MYKTLIEMVPILVSIVALGVSVCLSLFAIKQSEKALSQANRANEISEKAQANSTLQFTSLNRPLLVIKPDSFKASNSNFEIAFLDKKKVIIRIPILIKNVGNMVADNTFLHSTNCRLYLGNKQISACRREYETGTRGKLTFMDIPPNDGVVKVVDFEFKLPDGIDTKELRDNLITSGKMDPNFLLHYYSHLDKEKTLASNVSFEIAYKWYSILMIKV